MILTDFFEKFSHNNEVVIENKHNKAIALKWKRICESYDDCIDMDWMFKFTDIHNVEVIGIKNVLGVDAIVVKTDTDKEECNIIPDRITQDNAPLWLYNKYHSNKVQSIEAVS